MEEGLKYKIDILGDKYTVEFVDKVFNGEDKWVFGLTCTDQLKILVSTCTEDGVPLTKE